jgi:uncharacterized membrane-anchored protein
MNEPLASERVIIEAPLSFTGSAKRIWRFNDRWERGSTAWYLIGALLILLAVPLAWTLVLCWYLVWGVWLIPYRMIRRSSRKQKRDTLRHRELVNRP